MICINHRKIMLNKDIYVCSGVSDYVTPCTGAHQAPPAMGFPRKESWSGLPFPPPGDLPNPGMEPMTPVFPDRHNRVHIIFFGLHDFFFNGENRIYGNRI